MLAKGFIDKGWGHVGVSQLSDQTVVVNFCSSSRSPLISFSLTGKAADREGITGMPWLGLTCLKQMIPDEHSHYLDELVATLF